LKESEQPIHGIIRELGEYLKVTVPSGALVEVTESDNGKRTPLHLAAYFGLPGTVTELLARKYEPDALDSLSKTPLRYAVERGNVEVARILIAAGANVNSEDFQGVRLLFVAVRCGDEPLTRLLVESGANIDIEHPGEYYRQLEGDPLFHGGQIYDRQLPLGPGREGDNSRDERR
jgi:ankyrin repeat protein